VNFDYEKLENAVRRCNTEYKCKYVVNHYGKWHLRRSQDEIKKEGTYYCQVYYFEKDGACQLIPTKKLCTRKKHEKHCEWTRTNKCEAKK